MKLHWLLRAFLWAAYPKIDGETGGGAVDRGDDFTPTGSDAVDPPAPEPTPEVALTADDKKLASELRPDADADADADADPDADADADADPEATETKPKRDARITVGRHKEILEKQRAKDAAQRAELERQLAQFQQGQQVAEINAELTAAEKRLEGLEAEYTQLITDGHVEKATAKMREIRRLDSEINTSKSDMKIAAAESRAIERGRYLISLERVEAAYPQLKPEAAEFDPELLSDVADLKSTYERRGMTSTDALQKAVARLIPAVTTKQEEATTVKPKVDAAAVAAERKAAAVEKTAKAVTGQPPLLSKVGTDSDKIGGGLEAKNVIKLPYKDFAALSEEQLARVRGDVL